MGGNSTRRWSRRDFLQSSSAALAAAGLGAAVMSACDDTDNPGVITDAGPDMMGDAGMDDAGVVRLDPSEGDTIAIEARDRVVVFVMLDGGNDAYNTLVPLSDAEFATYGQTRGNLALARQDLLPLRDFTDAQGRNFGLHPSLPHTQARFGAGKLAVVANAGPLIERVTRETFLDGSAAIPLGLLSHADQFKHWQTARPGERVNYGWFGTMADVLQADRAPDRISMNISLAGSNVMQFGKAATEYAITADGSQGLRTVSNDPTVRELNALLRPSMDAILRQAYSSPFAQTYVEGVRHAQAQHEAFAAATRGVRVRTPFEGTDGAVSPLAAQLRMVARSIKAAPGLGHRQQTFFVRYIGWDHHDELIVNHARMLQVVDDALNAFQNALEELGVADRVVTVVGSDFGRTLTSNGNGTDHGWGGHALLMGEPVKGGVVAGAFPDLTLDGDNPLDAGDGVLIPTTATDEIFAEVARWFGVYQGDLGKLLPNLGNFWDFGQADASPLGLI